VPVMILRTSNRYRIYEENITNELNFDAVYPLKTGSVTWFAIIIPASEWPVIFVILVCGD